ncbi:MAG TPA: YetF domain-containing protein [Thermoanaerobaculia bacterium]|nr:YetF domain-containing protein [Thermoanaerobaculia bacterium]
MTGLQWSPALLLEDIARGIGAYLFLLLLFRLAGKRTAARLSTFDLIVVFLIGAAARPLMLRRDADILSGIVLTTTLVATHLALAWSKMRWPALSKTLDGEPVLLWENGKPRSEAMRRERLDINDILHAAREHHGLDDVSDVWKAYLELDGKISIVIRRPN